MKKHTQLDGSGDLYTRTKRLVSPGDIFQLGLFPLANGTKWYLGIWFTVSPADVICAANRDRPLNASSSGTVTLSGAGDLVLLDAASNNETVWSSNSSAAAPSAVAQLDDNGNLVLADAAGAVLWQSFDHPTNTYVSEMRIGKDVGTGAEWSLSSWRHAYDPSASDFRYVMDTRGSPELHIWRKGRKTYRTGPWNGLRFSGIPEMATYKGMFEFQFTDTADEVSYMYHACDGSPPSRVVLHESGVIKRMVWDSAALRWRSFWSGPRDECDRYGVCGAFGVCNEVDAVDYNNQNLKIERKKQLERYIVLGKQLTSFLPSTSKDEESKAQVQLEDDEALHQELICNSSVLGSWSAK
uniref:non-specific serine/threonine protein kinase n=1 Tax=Aegilops tauschii TaxID=37682 RepID=M8CAE5_AEGTA